MRSLRSFVAVGLLSICAGSGGLAAQQPAATVSIVASAAVLPRAAVQVSTQLLHFHVTSPDEEAVATLDFVVGARAQSDSEVRLILEPVLSSMTFAGEGDGTLSGTASTDEETTAARWIGGGLRTGRLRFTLRAAPGTYTVPVRLAVSVR
jgi:hypothetical protein